MNFLTKLVALKPGKTVHEMIRNVMQGKDEGADNTDSDEENSTGARVSSGFAGWVGFTALHCLLKGECGCVCIQLYMHVKSHCI